MMKFKAIVTIMTILLCTQGWAQGGYHFGLKGGLTFANQTWNQGERRPALLTHVNVFTETLDPNSKGALFAQLGYHTRGSAIRFFNIANGVSFDNGYRFNNLSLLLGAKKKIWSEKNFVPYYTVGIRAEYNLRNNLNNLINSCFDFEVIQGFICPYPDPSFVNKFTYGISIGGGLEFKGSEFFNPALEFTLSPDLGLQLDQPEIPGTSLRQARVRNVSFEVSLVLRFLREIVYVD